MKPFMVDQLQIGFEREKIMLSPFDESLYKQLIDYEVIRRSGLDNMPIFSDENDHFIDALGLAYLAFVLNFPELVNTIQEVKHSSKIETINKNLGQEKVNSILNNPWDTFNNNSQKALNYDKTDLPGDRPTWVKVNPQHKNKPRKNSWGSRRNSKNTFRSLW